MFKSCSWWGVLGTTYVKFVSDLRQVSCFLRVLRYNWHIIESGIKHHRPKPNTSMVETNDGILNTVLNI
jgi:hypothetical protein